MELTTHIKSGSEINIDTYDLYKKSKNDKPFQEVAKVTLEDDKIEYKISDVEKYLREYAEDEIDNYIEGKEMGWINDFINMSKCEIDFHDIALHILKDEGYKE